VEGHQVGAYRLLHKIGEGGMGSVYLAEHAMLGRRAAVKMLHPSFSSQPAIVTRFFNEARAATAISDPGIVQIFDFGHHVDGSAYIAMELLEGETLDRRLHRVGRLPIGEALRLMRQVASSLGAAHARGIVHRDLKPENIFVVRDPEVATGERTKIVDFGIAKLVGDGVMKTQTSAVMGTPTYMSPEQCRGAGLVDQRSDVYALGCLLFTLIAGRPPFEAEGIGDIIAMHLREPPRQLSQVVPGVPPEIDQLVLRCLAKDPAHRFASAGDLAVAIGTLLGSAPQLPITAPGPYARPPSHATPTTLSAASGSTNVPARSGSRGLLIGGIVALAAIGGVIAVVATRGGGEDKPAAAPVAAPAPAAAPAPPPPAPKPDPAADVAPRMKEVLSRFVTWSKDHAGAPCPDVATFGAASSDPWGHSFVLTCTDQPANQIVGLVSAGPDGAPGTPDDIASWQLGNDVTEVVRGARWQVAPPPKPVTVAKQPAKKPEEKKPTEPPKKPDTKPSKGVLLDENGIPVDR
jgi:serine/threonine-protein kinase